MQTINGILLLKTKSNIEYLLTSRLNQDPLENYFSIIRASNTNNKNPSVFEFNKIMAKLMSIKIITKFTNDSNCEDDDSYTILQLVNNEESELENVETNIAETEKFPRQINVEISGEELASDSDDYITEPNENLEDYSLDGNAARYYIGYVIQKMSLKQPCNECYLNRSNPSQFLEKSSEWLIFFKNYLKDSQTFGKLYNPRDDFFKICCKQIKIFEHFFQNSPEISNIRLRIMNNCSNIVEAGNMYQIENHCYDHNLKFLEIFIKILLFKNCKWISDKMKSKEKSRMPQK